LTLQSDCAHSQKAAALLADWSHTQQVLVKLTPRPQA
ncbi:MAG: hypothetical protein JWM54_432, partial [Acidobacteriaceae bacterium]|nr:hypothetical protein [Acidobacteriaceae bacterium]